MRKQAGYGTMRKAQVHGDCIRWRETYMSGARTGMKTAHMTDTRKGTYRYRGTEACGLCAARRGSLKMPATSGAAAATVPHQKTGWTSKGSGVPRRVYRFHRNHADRSW